MFDETPCPGAMTMRLDARLCQSTFVLWRCEGDSIEVQCSLAPHEKGLHDAIVIGEHGLGELTIEAEAHLIWGPRR